MAADADNIILLCIANPMRLGRTRLHEAGSPSVARPGKENPVIRQRITQLRGYRHENKLPQSLVYIHNNDWPSFEILPSGILGF